MQSVDLDKLEEIHKEATAGPWKEGGEGADVTIVSSLTKTDVLSSSEWLNMSTEDFNLVIFVRNALPSIIHELRVRRIADQKMREMGQPEADGIDRKMVPEPILHVIEQYNESWGAQRDEIATWVDKELS